MDSKSLRLSSSMSKSKEISLDVTPAMERLSDTNFDENHGVLVECVTGSGSRTRLIDVFDFQSSAKPLLMIYTDDGTSKTTEPDSYNYVNLKIMGIRVNASFSKRKLCS